MRFLVDECAGPSVARWLRRLGHDVVSVFDEAKGTPDEAVIQQAAAQARILLTNDKGFGEKVFRQRRFGAGVILLRLENGTPENQISVLKPLLDQHSEKLVGNFVVATENRARFTKLPS